MQLSIIYVDVLVLQLSVLCTVFGFGLNTTTRDLSYLIHRPGLLARSLLSMYVVMPAVAVLLALVFDFPVTVERSLMMLAISPVPPLLPKREMKAGGNENYALGLMAILALTAIVVMPLELLMLQRVVGRDLEMASGAVVRVVLVSILLPLAAGMAVRSVMPKVADWLEKPLGLVTNVLLPLSILVLLAIAGPAIWELMGNGTLIAIIVFVIVGFGVGHVLGAPDPDQSVVLAMSTACRHPAVALSLAAANFPGERFGATILLCLLVGVIAGMPYVARHRRHPRPAPRPA